jgi:phosphohistidine phosphatase
MKRHLYLIRHAKSSWSNLDLKDIERPLNKRGQRDAPLMAGLLKARGIVPDAIISSPAVRAITTARIIGEVLEVKEALIYQEPQIYEATVNQMLGVIGSIPDDFKHVLMFGHNPAFTYLAHHFGHGLDNLPTCGVISLETTAGTWAEVTEHNTKVIKVDYPKMHF